jgi:hypothetical protein
MGEPPSSVYAAVDRLHVMALQSDANVAIHQDVALFEIRDSDPGHRFALAGAIGGAFRE